MGVVVEAKGLGFRTGSRNLLRDISFSLEEGEHCALFGMNGSGKTTLLSIIAGFGQQTSGSLKLFGETPGNDNLIAVRKRIGFASSSFFNRFYKKEDVASIVLSGLSGTFVRHGNTSAEEQDELHEWSERLRIEHLLGKPYFLLSKGEQQKVLLARALISEPDLLLLDEPYSGLDISMRKELEGILQRETHARSLSIIQVTHRIEDFTSDFTRVILLRDGRIFAQDDNSLFESTTMERFLEQRDGSLNVAVNGATTGHALDNSYDHDSECAQTAGALTELGFMGEEIALYGVAWRDGDGTDRISVSTEEASLIDFLDRASSRHLIVSPVRYCSKHIDIPIGQKSRIAGEVARGFATEIATDFPAELFDALEEMRKSLAASKEIRRILAEMREELRDRFDTEGLQAFAQLVDDAAERQAINAAEETLHKQWASREQKKLLEAPTQSSKPTDLQLRGFVCWEHRTDVATDGESVGEALERRAEHSGEQTANVVINANPWEIRRKRDEKLARGFAVSPLVVKSYATGNDFMKAQAARNDFRKELLGLFDVRFKRQMQAFFPLVFGEEPGSTAPRETQWSESCEDALKLYSNKWQTTRKGR